MYPLVPKAGESDLEWPTSRRLKNHQPKGTPDALAVPRSEVRVPAAAVEFSSRLALNPTPPDQEPSGRDTSKPPPTL